MRLRFPSGFLKWIDMPLNKKFPFRGLSPDMNTMIQQVLNFKFPEASAEGQKGYLSLISKTALLT